MTIWNNIPTRVGTNSVKWDLAETIYKTDGPLLPMWVADMDFRIAPSIERALQQRLDHGVFGYSSPSEHSKQLLQQWLETSHRWTIDPALLSFHQGVLPAIAASIETFSEEGDEVVITSPVYPPFRSIPEQLDRRVVDCPLIENDGTYEIDFNALERAFQTAKLFIFCNPHNPGGTVWREEDIRTLTELAAREGVVLLSDEIHSDLVYEPNEHVPTARVNEAGASIITFVAPTKTFNLAGIQIAASIASTIDLKRALDRTTQSHMTMGPNAFALAAWDAAYGDPESNEWLSEMKSLIQRNESFMTDQLLEAFPHLRIAPLQSTYLLWIDYRAYELKERDVMDALLQVGRLALEPGSKYGEAGDGFLRLNLATSEQLIEEAVDRFIESFESLLAS